MQVEAFLGRPLDHSRYPYVFFDDTYLHGRLGQNMQVVSRASGAISSAPNSRRLVISEHLDR